MREILNANFYSVRSGCAWRLLPHDVPPRKTIYHYFRTWRIDGTSERMHNALRQRVRIGRDPQPSAGIVAESQSVKTTGVGGEQRGYDGGKKVKGRKHHLLVDTQGLVLKAGMPQEQPEASEMSEQQPERERKSPGPLRERLRRAQGPGPGGDASSEGAPVTTPLRKTLRKRWSAWSPGCPSR